MAGGADLTKAWRPPSERCQWSVHCLGDTNTCGIRFGLTSTVPLLQIALRHHHHCAHCNHHCHHRHNPHDRLHHPTHSVLFLGLSRHRLSHSHDLHHNHCNHPHHQQHCPTHPALFLGLSSSPASASCLGSAPIIASRACSPPSSAIHAWVAYCL